MSNPVDTDALNTDRLRSVASTLHSKAFHLMNAAADEVDRLRAEIDAWESTLRHAVEQRDNARAVIGNAPHAIDCASGLRGQRQAPCTCWKSRA